MRFTNDRVTVLKVVMLATILCAGSARSQEGTTVQADEREAITGALSAFHAALQNGESEKAGRFLGPSLFMADERSSGGPDRMSAHMFLAGEELQSWPRSFLEEAGPYRNDFRVLSVSVRGDAAVVLTSDTGSNRFRSWKDEGVAWFIGRTSGRWRIVGMVIRDIQLPEKE